jgi:hypothetical protein
MAARAGASRGLFVCVDIQKYADGAWRIDLVVTQLPEKHTVRIPLSSGEDRQQLSQSGWVKLLEAIRGLLDAGIADIIEPF